MAAFGEVWGNMNLHTAPDKFFIEPLDNPKELVIIDRLSYDIQIQDNQGQIPSDVKTTLIYGIVGIVNLLAGPYLVVITQKAQVGILSGEAIWRIEATDILPYSKTTLHLTDTQINDNRVYLSMLQQALKTDYFYFSYSYDLSHTMQRLHNTSPDFIHMSLLERADQRFMWNINMTRELAQQSELSRYCLPIVHGFLSVRTCLINQKTFTWAVLSRRSCFRAGTRFYTRGIDTDGNAANFVETEQIVEFNGDRCSYVQTRGSIPLFWSQRPNLRYMPLPVLNPTQNHIDGFTRHFDNQIYNYGKQVIVNLINHKGYEHSLEKAFGEMVLNINNPSIRYVSFDFHRECSKMRYDRLSLLLERVAAEQDEFGYFLRYRDGTVPFQQEGVFRTNCMDCLDRTNVVQSLLAKECLQQQLIKLGILQDGMRIEDQNSFNSVFKNVWADNADVCSRQYAGAGALKTDYTRTGKRTRLGAIKDGINSALRYYKNNFTDGFRQDSIDLFLGNYQVESSEGVTKHSPLAQKQDWKYLMLPVIFLVAMSMCFVTILIPTEYSLETLFYLLFWLAMSTVTMLFIFYYGNEFVDCPKLCENVRKKME
ncbi:Phosphoinositide phosphatase sac1 [Chamberlinius hualienensis]